MSPPTEFVRNSGGSIISRNALEGVAPIRWAFREEPATEVDNGWRFLSAIDDDAYLSVPANMTVVSFNTVVEIEPAVLPLLYLPVGSDIAIHREAGGPILLIDRPSGTPLQL
ncbi:DUF2185 domain-containing protein [Microbacterium sp. ZW T5_56]|uniref:immunity protein Imm33 domain-containing protein n=1 Tax=Microbacterium sp. ZW T5_56 TaxID=3378081 RepID=UPI003854DCB9